MQTAAPSFCICYNLTTVSFSSILIPVAQIVSLQELNGKTTLGYIEKQALPEVLDSYNILYQNTSHQRLLGICQDLKTQALTLRFQPKGKRKIKTIEELMHLSDVAKMITNYIHRKLAIFYDVLYKEQYPLSLQALRKNPVEIKRVHYGKNPVEALLSFTKTDEGIDYSFFLKKEDKHLLPCKHDIKILLNDPAWIYMDQQLFSLDRLNANKLKPFLDKDTIHIQEKNTRIYFEKVITSVIKKVDVISKGFNIIKKNQIHAFTFKIEHDFISNTLIGDIIFDYGSGTFAYSETKNTISEIAFDEHNTLQLLQTQRNRSAETEIAKNLLELGLVQTPTHHFEVASTIEGDSFAILQWFNHHKNDLTKLGFALAPIIINNQEINSDIPSLDLTSATHEDWFDIKGLVSLGTFEIPFAKLIPFIRDNNPYYPLSNGTQFIIPTAWMHKYKRLTDFVTVKDHKVKLPKSNYTLLKKVIDPSKIAFDEKQTIQYKTSPLLKATLRPYQLEGVTWLLNHYQQQLGACLADDMGLGKTLQTIALLVNTKDHLQPQETTPEVMQFDLFATPLEVKTYLKTLIVLPSSLVFNWAQELLKFAPHFSIANYTGSDRKKLTPYLNNYDVILTTYHTVLKDIEALERFEFSHLIIDESQQIKNKDSKLFNSINRIDAQHKISLSGTPIENSLSDLWAQMEFINPGMLGSYAFFKRYFKTPIEKQQDEEKIKELKELIEPFILRRTKEQVAKDLPEVLEHVIYTEMLPDQEKVYEIEKSAARNHLLQIDKLVSNNKIHIINTLTKLRQLSNHPRLLDKPIDSGKFNDVTNYLETLIKANKKVLIFSSFVSHLNLYQEWCIQEGIKYASLTGKDHSDARKQAVTNFKTQEDILLFFISLKAGGTGLNLTEASYVILLDPWWNPFIEKQAIARAHRIGQQNKVIVTKFITKNTIEEKIMKLQDKKKSLSDDIIATDAIPQYIDQELDQLLK
ncbi:DEAD/DEAH box helicase [Aquimarina rhabdastrellae]